MKNIDKLQLIFLALLALACPSPGYTQTTDLVRGEVSEVRDLSFYKTSSEILEIDEYIIRYEIFYLSTLGSNGVYSPEFVRGVIDAASRKLFRFLKYKDIPISYECRYVELKVHHITSSILNDTNRFSEWRPANRVSSNQKYILWALFDPVFEEPRTSAIYLTDNGRGRNEGSLAHELAHYWYDRLCVYNHWNLGTEEFAVQFQEYYSRGR